MAVCLVAPKSLCIDEEGEQRCKFGPVSPSFFFSCYNIMTQNNVIKNKYLFLTVLEAGKSEIYMVADSVSSVT